MKSKNKPEKSSINIDRVLGVITVVISLVALILSIQANRISAEQASDNVVVLSSKLRGTGQAGDASGKNNFVCRHVVTVFNFGGASTALVDWKAKIRFKDKEIIIDATKEPFSLPPLDGRMHDFSVNFTDGLILDKYFVKASDGAVGLTTSLYREGIVSLQRQIDAHSLSNIYTEIPFILDGHYSWDEMEVLTRPSEYENPQSHYGLDPVEVSYEFSTASGYVIKSPYTPCFFLK